MAPTHDSGSPAVPSTTMLPGAADGNGHGELPDDPFPTPRRPLPGPSTRPALVVLGIILALFLVGFVVETISSGGTHPVAAPHSLVTAQGAPLRAVPAGPLVHAIVSQGQPPSDIVNALAAPAHSTDVPNSTTSRGVELYDRSIRLQSGASQQDVISFYGAQMPALHWKRLSEGPQPGGTYQLLFEHPGSDGHEWELGVTVSPTRFPTAVAAGTPATSPASGSGTTIFTLRLFAQSDTD